jgi:myo-inositol-1(or 4)-monophosphatase
MGDAAERYAAILERATSIAKEAGDIVARDFPRGSLDQVGFKGSVNPVTETDGAAEALIRDCLERSFPEHRILGEESGASSGRANVWREPGAPIWLVDPLDGTNNFAHGFPHVGVSLALLEEQEPVIGVIYDPLREEMFTATAGAGHTSLLAQTVISWHNTGLEPDDSLFLSYCSRNEQQTTDRYSPRVRN